MTLVPRSRTGRGAPRSVPHRLSRWYRSHARDLPWRRTRDPYSIWVSEVMLQQTQVTTVIPYYERFLERFPDLGALARAPEQELLTLWAGLGYYSRARNLQKGARHVMERGGFPKSREEMLRVPGIGPYTAGAILSIAFDLPVPLVDGNVVRVLSRWLGEDRTVEQTDVQKRFWQECERWVKQSESPRVFNQALMELGATVCTRGTPRCDRCPLQDDCDARARGNAAALPRKKPRRARVDLWWVGAICIRGEKVYLRPNPKGQWWEGLWDFPRIEGQSAEDVHQKVERLSRRWGKGDVLGPQKHNVTHHRITTVPVVWKSGRFAGLDRKAGFEGGDWFALEEVKGLPLSSLSRKLLRAWSSSADMI